MTQPICGRQDRVRNTDGPYHGPTYPRLGHMFTGVQGGWELVRGDWRTGPERELLLAVQRWTEETGGRKSTAGNAYGGRPDYHGSRALLLSHTQGEEPLLQLLSPNMPKPANDNKKSLLRDGSCALAAEQ